MARRGENIRKRKDGRWEGRYIKARTSEGKIQWGYVYGTVYAEVKRVLIQKKAEVGFYNLKRTDLTFEALAKVWLHSLKNGIKESTYAHYSYTLHKYLLPVLSKVPGASLDESFLEQAMQQIITPKTRTSRREIPLPKQLLLMLKKLRGNASNSTWFLSGNESKPTEPRCYRKSIKAYLKQTTVRQVRPHALRHTFATTCLQAGCDVKTLSELLGHANANITLQRYVHSDLTRKRRDRMWGNKKEKQPKTFRFRAAFNAGGGGRTHTCY